MKDCPTCGAPVDGEACLRCGTGAKPETKTGGGERVTITIAGRTFSTPKCEGYDCRAPGVLSESTLGGGPWWCTSHFPPFRHQNLARTKRLQLGAMPFDFEGVGERLALQGADAT